MMNTCTYNSQSHDHYIVQNWRKSSHRAHKDFSQDDDDDDDDDGDDDDDDDVDDDDDDDEADDYD